MSTHATIFVESVCSGEILVRHLPIASLSPGERVSLPAPQEGELLLTFHPEEAGYLPLQRRIPFSQGQPVPPLPQGVEALLFPGGLICLTLHPQAVPGDFRVYPQVLDSRELELAGQHLSISRIRREVTTLLLSTDGVPLAEFPLSPHSRALGEVLTLGDTILVLPVEEEEGTTQVVLRREPAAFRLLLQQPRCVAERGDGCIILRSPLERDGQSFLLQEVTPQAIHSHLAPTLPCADPSYLLLEALRHGDETTAASLLAPELPPDALRNYLGPFQRILPPPLALPVGADRSVWALAPDAPAAQARLFVFSCTPECVQDIWEWE